MLMIEFLEDNGDISVTKFLEENAYAHGEYHDDYRRYGDHHGYEGGYRGYEGVDYGYEGGHRGYEGRHHGYEAEAYGYGHERSYDHGYVPSHEMLGHDRYY